MKCRQLNALPAELSEVPPTPGAPEQGHFSEVDNSLHCQAGSVKQSCVVLPLLQNRLFPEKLPFTCSAPVAVAAGALRCSRTGFGEQSRGCGGQEVFGDSPRHLLNWWGFLPLNRFLDPIPQFLAG